MFDFVSIGEILMDMTPTTLDNGEVAYLPNTGGAPSNVAAVASKIGLKTAFCGQVGDDTFGQLCKQRLEDSGVNTHNLLLSKEFPTTLAFVHLTKSGDRSFSFYRQECADGKLCYENIDLNSLLDAKILHFGSVSLAIEPSAKTTLDVVKEALKRNLIVTYDPNLRLSLWENEEKAREMVLSTIPLAHVLKFSEEEITFLFNTTDYKQAMQDLFDKYKTQVVLVTRAEKGCYALVNGVFYKAPAYNVKTVDTTGAGDAFLGGIILHLLKNSLDFKGMSKQSINEMLAYANAMGSLVTTKKGAISAIPTAEEVSECIKNNDTIPLSDR